MAKSQPGLSHIQYIFCAQLTIGPNLSMMSPPMTAMESWARACIEPIHAMAEGE